MFEFQKSREIGDIINDTFAFVRYNWKALGKSMLVFTMPFALIAGMLLGYVQANGIISIDSYLPSNIVELGVGYMLFAVFIFAATVMSMGVVYQYVKLYMEKGHGDISTEEVWDAMKPNLIGYSGYMFISFVVIFLGIMLCVIPGIYLLVPFSIIIAIKTFENRSLGDSMSRCFFLVRNYWWQTFLVLFLLYLISGIIGFISSLPSTIVSITMSLTTLESGEHPSGTMKILLSITSALSYGVSTLLSTITTVGTVLQYFNLTERKEGAGAMRLIDQLGEKNEAKDDGFMETY